LIKNINTGKYNPMKVCIVYDSRYGNGRKCAEYIGKVARRKHNVNIFCVDEVDLGKIDAELYIFSSLFILARL
jgi:menaquinone-dependent protoporphyrinogen IX oxidase